MSCCRCNKSAKCRNCIRVKSGKRCISCQPGRLGKCCNQPDSNQPDTTFPIANSTDEQPTNDDDAGDTVNEQSVTKGSTMERNNSLEDSETGEGHIGGLPYYQPQSSSFIFNGESFADSSDDFGTLCPPSTYTILIIRISIRSDRIVKDELIEDFLLGVHNHRSVYIIEEYCCM